LVRGWPLERVQRAIDVLGRHRTALHACEEIGCSYDSLKQALRTNQLGTPSQYLMGAERWQAPPAAPVPREEWPTCAADAPPVQRIEIASTAPCAPSPERVRATPERVQSLAQNAQLDPRDKSGNLGKAESDTRPDGSDDPRANPALHYPEAPPGYHLRGASTLVNAKGHKVQQWIKTAKDPNARKLDELLEAIRSLPDTFREAHKPCPPPEHSDSDLLCVYPLGDVHLGMHAWRKETGADYNLKVAEQLHGAAIDHLLGAAPSASQALIVNLGDFFHADNSQNRTLRAGNRLDVDTRWSKILRVGLGLMRRLVNATLRKHERVRVICEIGNHDDHSAIMMALGLEGFFERDERVEIDTSPDPFHWHRFGKNLLGVTHGSEAKPAALPGIMAATKALDWGQTRHRYWYTGHIHRETVWEAPGCVVESFRTLAPRDAWAHRAGYRADRDMRCDVLHREHGRITRHIVGVEQVG
jgi:hypothetical protein